MVWRFKQRLLLIATALSILFCVSAVSRVMAMPVVFRVFDPIVASPVAAAPKSVAVREYVQETSTNGKYKYMISPTALKIECQSFGYSLYASAPDWKVYAYRPSTRELKVLSKADFLKFRIISFTMLGVTSTLGKPDRVEVREGGKKARLTWGTKEKTSLFWDNKKSDRQMKQVEVDAATFAMPDEQKQIICHFQNLPLLPVGASMPLTIYAVYQNGERGWQMRTLKSAEINLKSDAAFRPPADAKVSGKIDANFMGKSAIDSLGDFNELLNTKE